MTTDWNTVRAMMACAIDTCEQLESMGYRERHRDLRIDVGGQAVSVQEFLVSAWTYPENLRYAIIRERHDRGADLPYVPEAARILMAMAAACAELVGASEAQPAANSVRQMIGWYHDHAVPRLRQAIEAEGAADRVDA
jgi:hypothetical protein